MKFGHQKTMYSSLTFYKSNLRHYGHKLSQITLMNHAHTLLRVCCQHMNRLMSSLNGDV